MGGRENRSQAVGTLEADGSLFEGQVTMRATPRSIRGIHVGNPPHAGPTSRSQIGLGEWLVIGNDGRFLDAFHAQLQFHRSVKQPIE